MPRSGQGWCPFAEQVEGVHTYTAGGENKVGIADHTAGGFYGTLKSASFWNNAGYSVHFGVSRKGEICQLVNIFDRAWGQGRDSRGGSVGPSSPGITWPPFAQMNKRNPNEYLISVEHEDAETVNGRTVFVPGPTWTDAQYAASLRLDEWCREEFKRVKGVELFKFGIDSLIGHYMFDPVNRANCPGKPWREIYRERKYNDIFKPQPVEPEEPIVVGEGGPMGIVQEPGSPRCFIMYGKILEWIPNANIFDDVARVLGVTEPTQVSRETFDWLVAQHKAAGGKWGA